MEAEEKLRQLFNKQKIKLTKSGDHAILSVLRYASSIGKTKALIQDQGGWLTYRDYPKKAGIEKIELKTNYGIIDLNDLRAKADNKTILLINSLTGYFAEQPMEEITKICAEKKCLLVNDASGSTGTQTGSFGDIILCSFGKDKPINLHYGGCIAYDKGEFEGEFDAVKIQELNKELDNLFVRLQDWDKTNMKIKQDLKQYKIVYPEKRGINVVIRFENEQEKQEITEYCKKNNYQYTMCPRYIRVNCDGISIEVKRLSQGSGE